jgi:molybdopterin molybdotransferase
MPESHVSGLPSVAEAIAIIDAQILSLPTLRVNLGDAHGLVLAADVVADRDYPPFNKSLMDGYAVRAADVAEGSVTLECIGEIAAGDEPGMDIQPGQAVAIMTGAPLPPHADAVVPVEMRQSLEQRPGGASRVTLRGPANPARYISPRGQDCAAGAVVLRRGQKLGPAQLAVAASVGATRLNVYPRPRAAVLATGNEIIPPDGSPGPSQIRNSNSIMLVSLLRRLGCEVTDLGTVADEPDLIRQAISRGMHEHDVLFITGGMSMGEHDYVPRVLLELGFELKITKLRIKPGKPFVFGLQPKPPKPPSTPTAAAQGKAMGYVFGLPGNPLSGFACTLRLCARLLARLAGEDPQQRLIQSALTSPLPANGPREFYQPAVLRADHFVEPLEWKGSGDVFTLAGANGLIVRPEHEPAMPAGSVVQVLEIPV